MRSSIVTTFLAALVTLAVPPRALAQEAAPAGAPAPVTVEPAAPVRASSDWSLGAGVSVPLLGGVTSAIVVSSSFTSVFVSPGATASLERRLAPSTWLVVGVQALYARNRGDEPPAGFSAWTRQDYASAGASVGIRRQVTGARAPVAVSILALAEGGWVDRDYRWTGGTGDVTRTGGSGWAAGGSLGLAVERELTGNLALRVSTPLLYASYSDTRSELSGGGDLGATGVTAGVALAPSLELRLSF